MDKSQQKFLWIFLALVLVLGAIWQFYPLQSAQGRLNQLPLAGADFQGKDIALTPEEQKFFGDINIIKRVYKIEDQYFFVTVLDGSRNRHIVHDPYYCFRGSGWTINNEKAFKLSKGSAGLLDISKGDDRREALFWFSDGSTSYIKPLRYWWQTTLRRVTLGASGPEPILIMIQPMSSQNVDWKIVTNKFSPLFKL